MRSTKRRSLASAGYADAIALSVIATVLVVVATVYAVSNLGHGHVLPQPSPEASDTPAASITPTASPRPTASVTPTTKPTPSEAAITAQVKSFYDAYVTAARLGNSSRQASLIDSYATSDLARRLHAATSPDPVYCADSAPASLAYSVTATTSSGATVRVTATDTSGSATPITTVVRLSDLKLVDITCPRP